jgi:threonine dehydrogenase-like Zn-dependent dehydrogenase
MQTMRALTVTPGVADSLQLETFRVPTAERGAVLIRAALLGVCGTDREIIAAKYGSPPPGRERLIIGHESLGRVVEAPANSGFIEGDLVAGIVRRPDPVPCVNCAVGEWDMCRNGKYTEHGIKSLDGFGAEYYRMDPGFVVKVDESLGELGVLTEPASVIAKAWEHIERIGERAAWSPACVLVTGAGPVGLLAALFALQRKLEVHVLDHNTEGPKPRLVRDLGATYHAGKLGEVRRDFDVVIEGTGVSSLVSGVLSQISPNGIICLLGVSEAGAAETLDIGALNASLVLGNRVVFGSVNANRRHYKQAIAALCTANRDWLGRIITRRVSLDRWSEAFEKHPHDVKTVIDFAS